MVGNRAIITDYDSLWKDLIQEFFEDFLLLLATHEELFERGLKELTGKEDVDMGLTWDKSNLAVAWAEGLLIRQTGDRAEDAGMKRLWGGKVSDLGFAQFVSILEAKAQRRGKLVIKLDRL